MRTDITVIQGDSATFPIELTLADGTVPSLSGATITLIVNNLFSKVVTVDESSGEGVVELDPDDTEGVSCGRSSYRYEVQVVQSDGDTYTLQRGLFTVLADLDEP